MPRKTSMTTQPDIFLSEINEKVRAAAPHRRLYLIAESETQQTYLVEPLEDGGYGLDAVWNDDFHHTALVRLTGRNESYYTDYLGTVQEFISAIKYGYLYQGQWYVWQNKKRGTPCFHLNLPALLLLSKITIKSQIQHMAYVFTN